MKKSLFAAVLALATIISCSKNETVTPGPGTSTPYMSMAAGSTRTYEFTNNNPPTAPTSYTLTSTNRDTTVTSGSGSRVYHVFTNSSTGASEYYNQTGNDYYTYQSLPAAVGSTSVEDLYLKDNVAVNTSWTQTYNVTVSGVPVTVNVINKIIAKDLTRTVNSISYDSVIHVQTDFTASSILGPVTGLTTNIHTYYAPRVGQIENTTLIDLNFMGIVNHTDTRSILKTSSIQ